MCSVICTMVYPNNGRCYGPLQGGVFIGEYLITVKSNSFSTVTKLEKQPHMSEPDEATTEFLFGEAETDGEGGGGAVSDTTDDEVGVSELEDQHEPARCTVATAVPIRLATATKPFLAAETVELSWVAGPTRTAGQSENSGPSSPSERPDPPHVGRCQRAKYLHAILSRKCSGS